MRINFHIFRGRGQSGERQASAAPRPDEFTFQIEAEGLTSPRLDELDDLYEALVAERGLLGPSLSGNLRTGTVDLLVTVVARDKAEAARHASEAFGRALVATGRTSSVARIAEAVPA